ncbi:MAG: hypothetical protein CMK83_24020 [Pseudomonadales bacterium]|nr:hypothetical protein [Pseudomonadales bacterium]MBI27124.1 hypothetical protein [Pseudomonadales bacterium]HAG96790.1 hypothetical protein [Gammaproteobacteria bacterium]HBO95582.1 hypothetical protein [Gammaproteobacteria bacterium]|tara:strand:- start:1065 stop:1505 length:441 start_codon:yes stop_codon:yes gene_type:complete
MIKEFGKFKTEEPKEFQLMIDSLSKENDYNQYFTLITWSEIEAIYELLSQDPVSPRLDVLCREHMITPFEREILEVLIKTTRAGVVERRKEIHRAAVAKSLRAMNRWKENRAIDLQIAELKRQKKTKVETEAPTSGLYDKVKSIWG